MIEPQCVPTSENRRADVLWRISGRLTALLVHEINNDLATLREKTGLAEDVLAARKIPDSGKLQSLGEIADSCESRLKQAVALIHNFSQIGKQMESDAQTADLGTLLSSLTPFFGKIARQQLLSVRMAVRQGEFVVAARPYPLLCCILALFENQCRRSAQGEEIVVEAKHEGSRVKVSLAVRRQQEQKEERSPWTAADLSALAADLGLSLTYSEGGGRVSLSLDRN